LNDKKQSREGRSKETGSVKRTGKGYLTLQQFYRVPPVLEIRFPDANRSPDLPLRSALE